MLDIYCNGLHPPMQTAPISFLPRSCGCLKRQEGRTCLGEKEQRQQGLTAELRLRSLLGRDFLLHEIPWKQAAWLGGRRTCAGLFKALLRPLPQLLLTAPNTTACPLVLTAATVTAGPALEALLLLVVCQNFPEE